MENLGGVVVTTTAAKTFGASSAARRMMTSDPTSAIHRISRWVPDTVTPNASAKPSCIAFLILRASVQGGVIEKWM